MQQKFCKLRKKMQPFVAVGMAGLALSVFIKPVLADNGFATVTGTVYVDKNGNGVQDARENGIPNVSVSDGSQITRTDENGEYSLDINPERRLSDIVFITVPSGYKVLTDANMTPMFYRDLKDLKADEKRVQDFNLIASPETSKEKFTFANLADVHVKDSSINNREKFMNEVAQLNKLKGSADFVLVNGDLTYYATDEEFKDYTAATATSELPFYPAPGNHDITSGPDYRSRVERYREYFGPEWYSFDYGNKHFVILENHLGFTQPEQLEWLKQDLEMNAKDKQVVAVAHIQLNAPDTPVNGTKDFLDVLAKYNTKLLLSGHTHINDVSGEVIPGAKNIVTSSTNSNTNDFTPSGYRLINMKEDKIETEFKMFGIKDSLTVIHPAPGREIPNSKTKVQFNVFNSTSTVEKVEFRIDNDPWQKSKQSGEFTWSSAWNAAKEEPGEHQLEVRATDSEGHSWEKKSTFQISEKNTPVIPKGGTDWSMFKGNVKHTGESPDVLSPNLNLAWSYQTPGSIITSSPSIVDGSVYIGTRDENDVEENSILSIDLATGKQRWQLKTNAQVQVSPAVSNGIVYASSVRGTIYAVNNETGTLLWEKKIGMEQDGIQRGRMYSSPTVADGIVYQGYSTLNGSFMIALKGETGETLWDKRMENDQFIAASPVVENGKLYTIAGSSYLYAMDAKTGNLIWKKRPSLSSWSHSAAALDNGNIYVGFRTGILASVKAMDGTTNWTYQSPDSLEGVGKYMPRQITPSSPAISKGMVYMGFPDGQVAAFDANTGEKKWKFETQGGIVSSAAVSGNTVYIGSNDGFLYGLNRNTGEPTWKFNIGAPVASSPAISGNTLVVGAFDGNLYAFTSK
ncbi:PQQ-binding-like beta-propeller repeat protein [Bacillus sp. sid0103]|uniref:outer membrane protein assembly factor BamB family protein n=1 Tax=Bacillus sp. sid0103 TaxID=2856337 RepID=UPI001C461611|nr:PQQ-binding-like beta-propeller repeat protein [Bacillus sp. sid0103]MBV7508274.1 PQQ-binding-like beta-propeller repeat protein [Bacillus sp. sid0103]